MAYSNRHPPVKSGSRGSNKIRLYWFSPAIDKKAKNLNEITKRELRRTGLLVRENAFQKHKNSSLSSDVSAKFMKWISKTNDINVVAVYFPINSEFDTLELMKALFFAGKEVCLPVVVKKNHPLVFRKWTPETELAEKDFGIPIPSEEEEIIPDLIVSPLISYDKHGVRLGYGGGFYDRTIPHIRKKRSVLYLGIAFPEQKSYVDIPQDNHDIVLDGIISSFGVHRFL